MAQVTSENMNKVVAVLVDGKLVSFPVVYSRISEEATIIGDFPPDLVHDLSATPDRR